MKKLIILDLNGILLCRAHKRETKALSPETLAKGIDLHNFLVWKRPGLDAFLEYALANFQVGIWTSAMQDNAHKTIDAIMSAETKAQLLFVWTQEQCKQLAFASAEYTEATGGMEKPLKKHKPLFYKMLSAVWAEYPQFSAANTLLIDDSLEKASQNPPGLHHCPQTWSIFGDDWESDSLLPMQEWLQDWNAK